MNVCGREIVFDVDGYQWFSEMGLPDLRQTMKSGIESEIPSMVQYFRRIIVSAIRQQVIVYPLPDTSRTRFCITEFRIKAQPDDYGNSLFMTITYSDSGYVTSIAGKYSRETDRITWECYAN